MNVKKMREITIVAQASLEAPLCAHLREWGASGYSVAESLSGALLGCHAGEAQGRHIRVETIVDEDIAEAILRGLQRDYFKDCSIVYFVSDLVTPLPEGCTMTRPSHPQGLREEAWGDYIITL
jgi:hypothetical protein